VGNTSLKVYGLLAEGRNITPEILREADLFIRNELPAHIENQGDDNGLGFVIIHPGDLGVSILAHWWVQGSVLCQKIRRKLYGTDVPLDASTRSVIACVWELELINAEQQIWRDTMMNLQPNPSGYLSARVTTAHV
jgi:hypothetical protein